MKRSQYNILFVHIKNQIAYLDNLVLTPSHNVKNLTLGFAAPSKFTLV